MNTTLFGLVSLFANRALSDRWANGRQLVAVVAAIFLGTLFSVPDSFGQLYDFNTSMVRSNTAPSPTADGTIMQPTDTVSDSTVSVQPVSTLPSAEEIALWVQSPIPSPTATDQANYQIYAAESIDGYNTSFSGPLNAKFSSSSSGVKLFQYNFANNAWTSVSADYSTPNLIKATITADGLFGLGAPGVPTASGWVYAALAVAMAAVAAYFLRKTKTGGAIAVGLCVIALAGLSLADVVTTGPATAPNSVAISNDVAITSAASATNAAEWEMQLATNYYKGPGVVTNAANWALTAPVKKVFNKADLEDTTGVAGATAAPGGYLYASYPTYNCATYAVRNGKNCWINPSPGNTILTNEHTLIGAATGGGCRVGDIITYVNLGSITHFAVVTAVDGAGKITQLESKWGRGPLMFHNLTQVPAIYGAPGNDYR